MFRLANLTPWNPQVNVKGLTCNWHTWQLWLVPGWCTDPKYNQWLLNRTQPPGEIQLSFQMNWLVNQRVSVLSHTLISTPSSPVLSPSPCLQGLESFSVLCMLDQTIQALKLFPYSSKYGDLHLGATHGGFLVPSSLGVPLCQFLKTPGWTTTFTWNSLGYTKAKLLSLKKAPCIIQALFSDNGGKGTEFRALSAVRKESISPGNISCCILQQTRGWNEPHSGSERTPRVLQ